MKIASYRTDAAAVAYEEGRRATHIILRLRTDDGAGGTGYTTLTTPAYWQAKPLLAMLEALLERTVGRDPMDIEAVNRDLMALGEGVLAGAVNRAVSVIDMALWDIRGKALGQPVYKLLGAANDRADVYAGWKLWWNYDLDTLGKHAAEMVKLGFKAMKFRLGGVTNPTQCAERARVMREAAGRDVDLMADANQSWDVSQSIAIGRALEPYRLYWLEDPVHHEDFSGLAKVAAELDTPVATGESYHSLGPFRHLLEARAVDRLIVDLDVGGLTQWVKVANLAQAYRVSVAGHTCCEVLVHAVCAVPNGSYVEYIPWAFPLWKDVPELVNGKLVAPNRPGLGIEVDESALAKHRVT